MKPSLIKLRQADGSLLIKAGQSQAVPAEISIADFSRETGISRRHIATLCADGMIKHSRRTPLAGGKIWIPAGEISRFLKRTRTL
jgi:hypothetical protein